MTQPTAAAPGTPPEGTLTRQLGKLVVLDLILGFALIWDRFPIPGVGQPVGILVMGAAIALGTTRRPARRVASLWGIAFLYTVMVSWAVAVSMTHGLAWQTRSAKMMILLAFALTVAVGRLHAYSILTGYVTGAVVNVVLFYAGLTPNNYPPYLTGFLGDKNLAGLVYGIIAVLGTLLYRQRRWRVVHIAVFGGLLFLTGSRTSMAAAAVAILWVTWRNRLTLVTRLMVGVGIMWALQFVEARFARIGVFSDREGTDWFREQVDLATVAKLARSPWWGDGLGTAWVDVGSSDFMFFHNSYYALRIEGGWVMVAIMLYLVGYKGMGLFVNAKVTRDLAVVEGAILVILVAASRLGEVFFTTPAALVLGMAWGLRYAVGPTPEEEFNSLPAHPPRRATALRT